MDINFEDKETEKKFLLPGGQRFYFKTEDLVSTINKYKDVSDNDPKSVTIEYGVHSVDSLSGSTGQGRGVNGMYFADNRLTKLNDISQSLDEMQSTGLICFDTFALGQGYSGAKDNVTHDIYNAGFRITIGEKLICLKSFVVKDENGNYSLGLYYVGDDDDDWGKNVSNSEYAFPIYWDKDAKNRKISQDDLLKAKVNLQIIGNKNLDEISEAKIKESQAITGYSQTDNEGNKLFLFAESGKYLYKEENVSDGNKIGQNSKIKRVGKISLLVLIPVLVFLLMFFVIKVAIAYAIIYAVLSIVVELIVYSIFFHKKREEIDKGNLKKIKLRTEFEREESIRDKIEKSEEYRKDIETLSWKYGTVKFDNYTGPANNYNGHHIMMFRFKQNENNKIVCIQYCICSLNSNGHLETYREYEEKFPNPESIICLNYDEQLHLKVSDTLTFCDKQGNEMNKEILTKLNATINLNDESFKDQMDNAAKNKIVNTLIK